MRRTYVRRRIFVGALAVLVLWLSVPAAARALGPSVPPADAPRRYVVQPGDTLWEIAVEAAPQEDPRDAADAIAAANGIGADVLPGQELNLPPFD